MLFPILYVFIITTFSSNKFCLKLIARATIPNLQNVPCDNPISFDTTFILAQSAAKSPEVACKANITMLKPGPIASQQELLKYALSPGPKQAVVLCKLGFKGKVNINLYHYAVIEKTLQYVTRFLYNFLTINIDF